MVFRRVRCSWNQINFAQELCCSDRGPVGVGQSTKDERPQARLPAFDTELLVEAEALAGDHFAVQL